MLLDDLATTAFDRHLRDLTATRQAYAFCPMRHHGCYGAARSQIMAEATEETLQARWRLFRDTAPDDGEIAYVEIEDYDLFDARAHFEGHDWMGEHDE